MAYIPSHKLKVRQMPAAFLLLANNCEWSSARLTNTYECKADAITSQTNNEDKDERKRSIHAQTKTPKIVARLGKIQALLAPTRCETAKQSDPSHTINVCLSLNPPRTPSGSRSRSRSDSKPLAVGNPTPVVEVR